MARTAVRRPADLRAFLGLNGDGAGTAIPTPLAETHTSTSSDQ